MWFVWLFVSCFIPRTHGHSGQWILQYLVIMENNTVIKYPLSSVSSPWVKCVWGWQGEREASASNTARSIGGCTVSHCYSTDRPESKARRMCMQLVAASLLTLPKVRIYYLTTLLQLQRLILSYKIGISYAVSLKFCEWCLRFFNNAASTTCVANDWATESRVYCELERCAMIRFNNNCSPVAVML